MDIGVIMDDRRGADTLELFKIKVLNILRGQVFEPDFLVSEIGRDISFYHVAIGRIYRQRIRRR